MLIWFQLWREFKLSIAEIISVFPNIKVEHLDKKFLILKEIDKNLAIENADKLGWTIKIVEFYKLNNSNEIKEEIQKTANKKTWKFNYGLSVFWKESNLKTQLIDIKKHLKQNNTSSRFINKDFQNLSSAQILWEKLIEKESDFNVVNNYFWTTIWVQDIESYSKRDYWKSRDMEIWMLPPKLAQIMINFSQIKSPLLDKEGARFNKENSKRWLYDPFCWLWTVLIEWIYMWIKQVFWSDYNPNMIEATKNNLKKLKQKNFNSEIIELDARDMEENSIILKNKNISIITEGFLWEIMTKKNISENRINIQRKNLIKLYEKFFSGLKKAEFKWNIVISFPFWELEKKYIYFTEIYDVLKKYCKIKQLLPTSISSEFKIFPTKSGSLLYKRDKQLVWREIFLLEVL